MATVKREFNVEEVWLSPVLHDVYINRQVCKVNYQDRNTLVVETPLLELLSIDLIVDRSQTNGVYKILVKTQLLQPNPEFRNLIQTIDKQLVKKACIFKKERHFLPCLTTEDLFLFYIPVYNNEVNVLVKNSQTLEAKSILDCQRGTTCRMTLLLSHVEAQNEVFLPIWNIIEVITTD